MKIAIIQPRTSYHVAGSEKVSLKHAEFLSRQGHVIDFYTSIPPKTKSFLFAEFLERKLPNISILQFDVSKNFPNLYDKEPDTEHVRWVTESLAFNQIIFDELRKNRPDIILSYYLPDSIFKPPEIPNVVYLSGYSTSPIVWYKSFIQFCDATISISSAVSEKWTEETKDVDLNYILGTGVDYPIQVHKPIVSEAKYNIVFAGRLIERKGLRVLLDAFKEVVADRNDVHLWILGEGEMCNELNKKITDLDLVTSVTLTGLVKNPYDYFAMADICVFPSLGGDGLMGVVLESMSVGKPVIVTTNNGNEDVIHNNVTGVLIEPHDVDALIFSVRNLLDDEVKRKTIGKNAQDFIANNVAWSKNSEKLSGLLTDIKNKVAR